MLQRCVKTRAFCLRELIKLRRTFQSHQAGVRSLSNYKWQPRILPGEEKIRIHHKTPDDPNQPFQYDNDSRTVYDVFQYGWKLSENGNCLGTRNPATGKYEWMKYSEVWENAKVTGSGFQELGCPAGQNTLIGISCRNRKEYVLSFLATSIYSSVIVPFYNHMPLDAVSFVIEQTEIPIFICDTEDKANFVIENKSKFPKLKYLVYTEYPPKSLRMAVQNSGLELLSFADVVKAGIYKPKKITSKPKPDEIFTVCWTSGTTGMPKGVILTHDNVTSVLKGVTESIKPASFTRKKVISYMPTGHIYEILSELNCISSGGSVGFFGGDVLKLMEDIRELKPEVIPMVPRILNRLYHIFKSDIQKHPLKRLFLDTALKAKAKKIDSGVISRNTVWDKFIFKNIQDAFGGDVECMITSAAPISPEVNRFYRCALGCYMFDAYGQTEIGGVTLSSPFDTKGGTIGSPIIGARIKLADVPEMEYYAKEDIGEICAKGPTVTPGYYKNDKATAETIDEDGWLHTGDIGKWLPNGNLAVVDRKKNLFKLSQGEYISPERVENIYIKSKLIAQILVEGLSNKEYTIGIVIPESEGFKSWAKHKGFHSNSVEELCADTNVRREFLKHMRKTGANGGLSSLEQIKNVYLFPRLLSIEEGLITPTLKMKRNIVKKHFIREIEALYEEGPLLSEDLNKFK